MPTCGKCHHSFYPIEMNKVYDILLCFECSGKLYNHMEKVKEEAFIKWLKGE